MERTYHAVNSEPNLPNPPLEGSRSSYEDDIPLGLVNEGIHFASIVEKKRLWWRNAIINTLFIASWYFTFQIQKSLIELNESFRFFFATLLSVYNKWMFAPDHLGFPAPLFVTTIHMFIQFTLAAILRAVWPKTFRPPHNPSRRDYGFVL